LFQLEATMNLSTVLRSFPAAALLVAVLFPVPVLAVSASPTGAPPYEVVVVVDGVPRPEYLHEGSTWIEGSRGHRYALRLINHTNRRVEVVATVDGLDVVDGKTGDYVHKRGYVLGPWQTYDVEGFRLDMGRVAAFRFSSVAGSYAARTGNARNVGVIGVAFFEERRPLPPPHRPPVLLPMGGQGHNGDLSRDRTLADGDFRAQATPADESAMPQVQKYGGVGGMGKSSAGPASAAPAPSMDGLSAERSAAGRARPGLGTSFGESRDSDVVEASFVRARAATPTRLLSLRYDDRAGLLAQGVPVEPPAPRDSWLRATADPFPAVPHPRRFAQPPSGWNR
jgi:hypothetical protein